MATCWESAKYSALRVCCRKKCFVVLYVFSFPGVYVGTLNLIASIPDSSILISLTKSSWQKYDGRLRLFIDQWSGVRLWSGNLLLFAPFPDLCLLVPFYDGPDLKLFILVGWGRSFLSVAWPTGVQLVFFFCSGVSRLFGAQGSLTQSVSPCF